MFSGRILPSSPAGAVIPSVPSAGPRSGHGPADSESASCFCRDLGLSRHGRARTVRQSDISPVEALRPNPQRTTTTNRFNDDTDARYCDGVPEKLFHERVFQRSADARPAGGFGQLSDDELEAHLGVARYGDFELSDAVRPSYNLEVVPSAGFRHDVYRDEENRRTCPS